MSEPIPEDSKNKAAQCETPSAAPTEDSKKADESITSKNQSNRAAQNPTTLLKPWRIWKIPERVWNFAKKPESTNVAMAIATIVIAIATWFTWREVHNGSTQTDRIVAADERLAKADERFATAMENTVTQNQNALNKTMGEMQQESKAMQQAADAAGKQAGAARIQATAAADQVSKLQAGVDETSKLASAAAEANKIAQQAIWVQTRPSISIEGNPNVTQFASGGSSLNFTLTLRNYGQSPAIMDEPDFLLGDIGKGETRLLPPDFCSHTSSRFLTPIFPGREIERRIQVVHTPDSMPSPNSKRFDYLYGCIVYHGPAGSPAYNVRVVYYVLYSEDITRIEKIEFRDMNVQ